MIQLIKIYLSGPFFSPTQVQKIKRIETALSVNSTVNRIFSPRKDAQATAKSGTTTWRQQVYRNDMQGLLSSNVIVAMLDFDHHDTDSGTAYEIGQGKAHRIPVVIVKTDHHATNLMISESADDSLKRIDDLKKYDFRKLVGIKR